MNVKAQFPQISGRDFSGVIVDVGSQVKHLQVGDEVWGAIDAKRQGTHAEFCLASEKEISMKPKSISHVEAAALPFVAATTFASLVSLGGLSEKIARCQGKKVIAYAESMVNLWWIFVEMTWRHLFLFLVFIIVC